MIEVVGAMFLGYDVPDDSKYYISFPNLDWGHKNLVSPGLLNPHPKLGWYSITKITITLVQNPAHTQTLCFYRKCNCGRPPADPALEPLASSPRAPKIQANKKPDPARHSRTAHFLLCIGPRTCVTSLKCLHESKQGQNNASAAYRNVSLWWIGS